MLFELESIALSSRIIRECFSEYDILVSMKNNGIGIMCKLSFKCCDSAATGLAVNILQLLTFPGTDV